MAGGPNGGRGGLGWIILAAALAVPGFLFYNWWSHLKAERDHAISAKASKRADGGVFQTLPPTAGRLVNPMSASTSAPAGMPQAVPPRTASTSATAGVPPALAGVAPAFGGAAAPAAAAPVSGGAPAIAPPPGAAPAGTIPSGALSSTAAAPTIVLTRDPMMSPMDLVRLQEAALAEEARLRALAEASRPKPARVKKKPMQRPIETKIELQGIVAKADGENLAIINGTTVNPGESFTIDNYKGKVKVVKITSSEVMLDYNGRKIRLSVNVE